MGIPLLVLLVSIPLADAAKPVANAGAAEFAQLDGTWFLRSSVKNGERWQVSPRSAYMLRATASDQKIMLMMHHRIPGVTVAGDLTLNPSASPKQFDFKTYWNEIGTTTIAGVYELDDGELHVCFSLTEKNRPATLESTRGSNLYEMRFQRHAKTRDDKIRQFTKSLQSDEPQRRVEALGYLAEAKLEDGKLSEARRHAEDLAKSPPEAQDIGMRGSATHQAHILLGLIDLRENRIDEAARHLQEAARAPISRRMKSRGPDLRLAKGLLDKNRQPEVLEYLQWCKTFWFENDGKLDRWIADLQAGQTIADLNPEDNAGPPPNPALDQLQQMIENLRKK